jgi:hypothetical protein
MSETGPYEVRERLCLRLSLHVGCAGDAPRSNEHRPAIAGPAGHLFMGPPPEARAVLVDGSSYPGCAATKLGPVASVCALGRQEATIGRPGRAESLGP